MSMIITEKYGNLEIQVSAMNRKQTVRFKKKKNCFVFMIFVTLAVILCLCFFVKFQIISQNKAVVVAPSSPSWTEQQPAERLWLMPAKQGDWWWSRGVGGGCWVNAGSCSAGEGFSHLTEGKLPSVLHEYLGVLHLNFLPEKWLALWMPNQQK